MVTEAASGLQALSWLDAGADADLLISDFAMPAMNGRELIQEVRHRYPEPPALLMTGYAGGSVRLAFDGPQRRNVALLRKPVSGAALGECATALLRAGR